MKTIRPEPLAAILEIIRQSASTSTSPESLQQEVVKAISRLPGYDWVGFYMLDPNDPETWFSAHL